MWLLKKLSDGSQKYLISESKSYTIGRKNCDIPLEEDASISRKHCTIYIAKQNECPFAVNTLTGIWVVDEQSKYGTYLKSNGDWIKVNPNQNKQLRSGSVIKFGLMDNVWSLEFKPLIACASGVQIEQKKKIETTLQSVDGHLKNMWCKECSMVIVNEITLTVKVVLALINGVPIVTPSYVEKVVESIKNQVSFPNYEDYRPAIKESILDASLVSLDIKSHRKELFKGKSFVIPIRKQLETLREVIISAGGKVEPFTATGNWEKYAEENIVLIQLPLNNTTITQELHKSFKEVASFLKNNYGRRVIPESEIAQAVAYSSTEKYCNPKSTCFNLVRVERQFDPGVSLVHETPEIIKPKIPEPCVVPSSATIGSELIPVLPSQSNENNEEEEPKQSAEKRKRTHSTNQLDQSSQRKKARSKVTANDGDVHDREVLQEFQVMESKPPQKNLNLIETDSSKIKKTKTACITNFFKKQNKFSFENTSQVQKQNSPKFWNKDEKNDDNSKRKLSTGSDDICENSSRKKVKIPEANDQRQVNPEFVIQTPREVVDAVMHGNNNKDIPQSSSFGKMSDNKTDNDFADYIEREKMDVLNGCVNDLNNTIFSLTLISSAFLKADGTLIDPPSVPVNVKKFRKQKVHSSLIVVPLEQSENELSDGEWIEPHPGRLNISLDDEGDW